MEDGGGGTGTLNAHIWNHLTSVLLTELNSFYRLEHILLCSGQGGGWPYFSDEEQSREKISAALTCTLFPLNERRNVSSHLLTQSYQ